MVQGDVVSLSAGDLFALRSRGGKPLWRTPLGGGARESTLHFARGILYIAAEGMVSAVNARDATLLWHTQCGDGLDTLLAGDAHGTM